MTPAKKRTLKRIIISAVYLAIFCLLILGVRSIFNTKPTCNDGIRNQNEEKADCGGPCPEKCEKIPEIENIQVIEKAILVSGDSQYDVLVKINNPNSQFGIADFEYSLDLVDSNGKVIGRNEGTSFILPSQTKYIMAFNLASSGRPNDLDFKVRSFRWTKFTEYEEPLVQIYAKEFNIIGTGSDFATLKARIKNLSDYDFRNITVKAIIRNEQNAPVALNQTNANDVKVNEEREVVYRWSNSFEIGSDAPGVEINAEIDFFSDENFMKKYGSPEQYKSYETGSE